MELKIITGFSGAGKSTALNIFEDMGYYAMDNIPSYLLEKYIELNELDEKPIQKMAVVIDFRSQKSNDELIKNINQLKKINEDTDIIFLYASYKTLLNRYNELRRPHPFGEFGDIKDGIEKETHMLKEIRNMSDFMIDTSNYNYSDLKLVLEDITNNESKFIVNISSFGYKYGILDDGDFIFDVRFLPNPYYIEELRPLNGTDEKLIEYLDSFKISRDFLKEVKKMLSLTIEGYKKLGKNILNIGFGCTGGKHRSVYMTEQLAKSLENSSYTVIKKHRDKNKW
ncbi:MAG: RNase adapter RapZ [Tissierellia bacterium]|nr:RNase adapter RapZ [Tissierellia bacterium]